MRIAFLNWRDLAHPDSGGAEVYTESVLRRWAAQGHEVTLFAAAVEGQPLNQMVDGYRVVRGGGRLGVYRAARRWWQAFGRGRTDVVIDGVNTVPFRAHQWVDDGTPVVGFFHQTCEEIWHYNAPLPVALMGRHVLEPRWLSSFADVPVLAVSESTKDALARFGVSDITVVPEGFESSPAAVVRPKETTPTAVFCGRLVPYKRPDDAIRAAATARKAIPDLQLWLVGGGPMEQELRGRVPDWVTVHGRVSEERKYELMARAHVHLATSVREGWGLVVSEAAAVGTPTIAYDAPGLRDSTLAANGAVVPVDPAALGAWLRELLPQWQHNPPEPMPYGGASSWDEVAAAVLKAVQRAIARRGGASIPQSRGGAREVSHA